MYQIIEIMHGSLFGPKLHDGIVPPKLSHIFEGVLVKCDDICCFSYDIVSTNIEFRNFVVGILVFFIYFFSGSFTMK